MGQGAALQRQWDGKPMWGRSAVGKCFKGIGIGVIITSPSQKRSLKDRELSVEGKEHQEVLRGYTLRWGKSFGERYLRESLDGEKKSMMSRKVMMSNETRYQRTSVT